MYYLGSRFYDPAICRFVNADTTDVLMANPSSLTDKNLYSYCDNNPVMRTDDGGEFWNIAAGAVIGGIISMATQVVTNVVTGESIGSGVLLAGVSGAVSGAIAATGLPCKAQMACNALISGVSETINQYKEYKSSPEKFNFGKAICSIGISTGLGALAGKIGGDGAKVTQYGTSLWKYVTKRWK